MASQGVARKSKSAINFPTKPRDEASSDVNNIQRVNKRLQTDSETNSAVMPEVTITNTDENLHGSANTKGSHRSTIGVQHKQLRCYQTRPLNRQKRPL